MPASADRGGRDFTLAVHLSAVGEGTQKLERENRGWERGREAEKMETEGDTGRQRETEGERGRQKWGRAGRIH